MSNMLQFAISIILLLIPVGFVGYVAHCYFNVPMTNPPMTPGQKLFYATKKSATLFVQFATAAFLALGNGVLNFADFFGAPELKEWVKQSLTPELASGVIALLLFLTVWARVRSLGVTTPPPAPPQSFMEAVQLPTDKVDPVTEELPKGT